MKFIFAPYNVFASWDTKHLREPVLDIDFFSREIVDFLWRQLICPSSVKALQWSSSFNVSCADGEL